MDGGVGWQHTRTRPVNPLQQPLSLGPDAAERQDRETWACFRQPPTWLDLMQADNRRTGVSGQDGIQQGEPLFIIILRMFMTLCGFGKDVDETMEKRMLMTL